MLPRPPSAMRSMLRPVHVPGTLISLLRTQSEKRRFYRVPQAEFPPLWVGAWSAQHTPCVGQCTDVSYGGAGVRFAPHQDPQLEAGQEIALSFQSSARPGSLQTQARVVSVCPLEAGGVRYGFQFTNPHELSRKLDPTWASLFNRRHLLRATPAPGSGLWACLRWTRGEIHARVLDLSLGGLGAAVPMQLAAELRAGVPLHVSMQLPGENTELRVKAQVRSNKPLAGEARIGLEFDKDGGIERYSEALQRCIERRMTRGAAPKRKPGA